VQGLIDHLSAFYQLLVTCLTYPLIHIGTTPLTVLTLTGLCLILYVSYWGSTRLEQVVHHALARGQRAVGVDDSTVYAITRLVRYFIWFGGTLLGLTWIGLDLNNLALIGGAIGVGIGFGLQNIFSNFVSGIILIFERSLKMGDFVDLQNGTAGMVNEIALRYTRITTRDNVNVIIPNSEFINGTVINWSYNEKNRRIHVPFGVAYGCDKDAVRTAAVTAARRVTGTVIDDVLRPVEVWLTAFGDSSLNFELVVWVEYDLMTRPGRTQALYLWEIETELRLAGIEIPFPQRDLHIRSGTLSVRLHQDDDGDCDLRP